MHACLIACCRLQKYDDICDMYMLVALQISKLLSRFQMKCEFCAVKIVYKIVVKPQAKIFCVLSLGM